MTSQTGEESSPHVDSSRHEESSPHEEQAKAVQSPLSAKTESPIRLVATPHVESSPRVDTDKSLTDEITPENRSASATEKTAGSGRIASWREPRADGRLRIGDRLVVDFLKTRLDENSGVTYEVKMKEIASACHISHRTAQNIIKRLQAANVVSRLEQELGGDTGCCYKISAPTMQSSSKS